MFSRIFFALVFVATATFGQAPPCPGIDPGWTANYSQGTVQFAGYNISTQNLVVTINATPYPIYNRIFAGVPQAIFQKMAYLTNAQSFFYSNIAPVYHEALLTTLQSNPGMCPILAPDTGLWIETH